MPNGSLCVHKFIFSLRRGAVGSTLEGEKGRAGLLSLAKTQFEQGFERETAGVQSSVRTKRGNPLKTSDYKENFGIIQISLDLIE